VIGKIFRRLRGFGLLTVLLSLHAGCAYADSHVQQDLYLDAMRSLNEGRQNDASDALMRMIEQEPQHAGAWLDLAIIQCELGHAAEAERLFKTIETRFSPPPAIMEVIKRMRERGCDGWVPRSNLTLSLGRGLDSNVNQGASNPNFTIGTGSNQISLQLLPEFMPQSDHYTVASLEYFRDITTNGTIGFVQTRLLQNDHLSSFNTALLAAGVEHPWRFDDWSVRGTGTVSVLGLGGKVYQRQLQTQARITPPWQPSKDLQFSTLVGLSRTEYATLENFNSNTLETRGLLTYKTKHSMIEGSVGYSIDHGQSARPGGDRSGWLTTLYARSLLTHGVIGELSWTRQTWDGQSVYSPGLIDQIRHQDTQMLRGGLLIPLGSHQSLNIELRQVRNNENISLFQYNSRQLQLTWQWQPF
jgi:hypothetical protein